MSEPAQTIRTGMARVPSPAPSGSRRAAYGGTSGREDSPMGLRSSPRHETLTLFDPIGSNGLERSRGMVFNVEPHEPRSGVTERLHDLEHGGTGRRFPHRGIQMNASKSLPAQEHLRPVHGEQ